MFRKLCGAMCLLLAAVFLIANILILARYGWRAGADEYESTINAGVAGSVPIALALMPFFLAATWRPGHWGLSRRGKKRWRIGRPNGMVVVGFALYLVFIAFNFMGAIGSIALQKTEYVDKREGVIDDAKRWREVRARKAAELSALDAARPVSTVQADIEGAKVHRFWRSTDGCKEGQGLSRTQSKFCGSVFGWRAELGRSEAAEKLRGEIEELDRKLSSPAAHIASADPQGETLARYASLMLARPVTAGEVRIVQPLVWFALLELSCMFMVYMGLTFFRFRHADLRDPVPEFVMPPTHRLASPRPYVPPPPAARPANDTGANGGAIPGEIIVHATLTPEDAELQAATYERFWADCMRRVPAGSVASTAAYSAYRSYCHRPENRSEPFGFGEFVRRAAPYVEHVSTIGGVTFFAGLVLAEPMGAL